MAGAVFLHVFAHAFVEQLSVFGEVHVDEVDNDDASHVAQSQLSCQLVCGSEVHVQCVSLLSVVRVRTVAAVHVYHVQGLRVLDDKISAVLVVDGFAEAGFNLLSYVEIVEDGNCSCIQLNDVCFLWGDE